jgi:peptidoglycan/xylan/chitin deacetylase (PgdA/CDA1 family)
MWGFATAVLTGGVVATVAHGIRGRSTQLFGPSVYRGPGKRKSIALTFDDGPSEGSLQLLDYLAGQGVKATFFECGMNIERHPAIARTIRGEGHEIANHTYSHPHLYRHSPAFIDREFSRTQQIIQTEIGVTPTLLRAPYGLRGYGIGAAQKKLGLLGVMWTVIGHDWEWPAGRVAGLVLRKASTGGIICLHDGRDVQVKPDISEMLAAVKQIVPVLKDQGYSFETVTQLLQPDRSSALL